MKAASLVLALVALCGCQSIPVADREPMRVTLTFDDSLKDHWLIAAPELERRGWRGTFNLVTDSMGADSGKLTWDDARNLVAQGHELATHTKTHPDLVKLMSEKGVEAARAELALSRDAIAEHAGFTPRFYCSPFTRQNEATARLCREEGLEQYSIRRRNFGEGSGTSVREYLIGLYTNGVRRADILHHGVCSREHGGHGGWRPFGSRAEFAAHLDAIAELERAGLIVVTDYDGAVSDCRLKATAWPHHGVVALSFDDHNLSAWERALPLFARYRARTTFFLSGSIGTNEIAFAHRAMLEGHEVGMHGQEHRNADVYSGRHGLGVYWQRDVAPQLEAFRAAGIRPRSFAYPNCRRTDETDRLFMTNGFTRVRGLMDGVPCPAPYDPKNERSADRHPVAESDSEFFPAADYLKMFRIRNVIMGEAYHTDIEDISKAVRRAGERGEMLSLVSHGIRPDADRIHMKTAWLERLLSEADSSGVIIRGVR